MTRKLALFLFIYTLSAATQITFGHSESNNSSALSEPAWFKGNIDQAFKAAKDNKKPVFLFWGAQWCPPCNQIKADIFSHENFATLMKNYLLVYLDGDSERAQIQADKFNVKAYPVMLILDSNKQELLRVQGRLNFTEFTRAIESVNNGQFNIHDTLAQVTSSRLSNTAWLHLADISWNEMPDGFYQNINKSDLLDHLFINAPKTLPLVRTKLAVVILQSDLDNLTAEKIDHYLTAVFFNPESVLADRTFINLQLKPVARARFTAFSGIDYQAFIQQWLNAATLINEAHEVSLDDRLKSLYPRIQAWELTHQTKAPTIKPLQEKVRSHCQQINQLAKTAFERQSVIINMADMLGYVDLYQDAEALLHTEIKTTTAPCRYYNALARIAKQQGKSTHALDYAKKAIDTAQGNAIKIQLMANQIQLLSELKPAGYETDLSALLQNYFTMAFNLSDGFVGRNRTRMEQLAPIVNACKNNKIFAEYLASLNARCKGLNESNRMSCHYYFNSLTTIP